MVSGRAHRCRIAAGSGKDDVWLALHQFADKPFEARAIHVRGAEVEHHVLAGDVPLVPQAFLERGKVIRQGCKRGQRDKSDPKRLARELCARERWPCQGTAGEAQKSAASHTRPFREDVSGRVAPNPWRTASVVETPCISAA